MYTFGRNEQQTQILPSDCAKLVQVQWILNSTAQNRQHGRLKKPLSFRMFEKHGDLRIKECSQEREVRSRWWLTKY